MKRSVIAAAGLVLVGAFIATWSGAADGAAKAESPAVSKSPEAGKDGWMALFDGKDLDGWHMRDPRRKAYWVARDGLLINEQNEGTDIISDVKLVDQELHVEFSCPPGGNSGVYLQGRYEVQVCDSSKAKEPEKHQCGSIYDRIAPKMVVTQALDPAWQSLDIKFIAPRLGPDGKVVKLPRITIRHNGNMESQKPELIIDDAEIPGGVTGSAVDNKEGTPAGLMLQGDHSRMKYRNILYRAIPEAAK